MALVAGAGSCLVRFNTAGAKILTATYSGDANYNASVGTANHTVNKGATTTTITSPVVPEPSLTFQNVTVIVTVTGAGVTPTGSVALTGADTNCTVTLVGGTGNCVMVFNTIGAKSILATYGGDGNYNGSTDSEPHTVN